MLIVPCCIPICHIRDLPRHHSTLAFIQMPPVQVQRENEVNFCTLSIPFNKFRLYAGPVTVEWIATSDRESEKFTELSRSLFE